MNRSLRRGIFLSIALLFSSILIVFPSDVNAEEINVKSFALEETTVIELTNDSDEEVNTFRIWLGSDFNFKSFKTEDGWRGEKTPQGVIIFTSSQTIKPGESVKFGVKTDKANAAINWKALNKGDKQLDIGLVLPEELPKITQNTGEGISKESSFRIVPERPNVGSSIRVTGDNFGASQEFDFYINSKKIGIFETDEDGHFMTTMKIPEDQKAERVDFKVKDKEGEEKEISLRIGETINRIPTSQNIDLTIKGIPEVMHRGDFLEIFGTADPGSAVTVEVSNPEDEIINSRTAEVNSKGNWELAEPIIVPLDTPFGEYSATITDGRQSKVKQWNVESDKTIIITPDNLKYEPGETMKFEGIASPNTPIEITLEDPLGKELISDIIQVDDSGVIEFEFPTTQTSVKGTYTLIATQGNDKEFIFAGIGQLPTIPVNLEFDKLNYKASETAIISFTGKASDVISLLIIDPSDKPKEEAIPITLQEDATATYSLDLKGYSSGVYTAVISKGSTQNSEIFTVGLRTGSGEISINTTKEDYQSGDSILILGDTGSNVLLTITMTDPEGNVIKTKDTFSDKNGKISENSFRIPSDGEPGKWMINAKSGSNYDNIEFEVLAIAQEGMVVSTSESPKLDGVNDFINIHVFGAKHTVNIEIVAEDGKLIEELEFPSSRAGEINQPWKIPTDMEPGTYTIKVYDAFNSAETTFEFP